MTSYGTIISQYQDRPRYNIHRNSKKDNKKNAKTFNKVTSAVIKKQLNFEGYNMCKKKMP